MVCLFTLAKGESFKISSDDGSIVEFLGSKFRHLKEKVEDSELQFCLHKENSFFLKENDY